MAPAKKQIILGKGTCNGVDTVNHFNPAIIDQTKVAALRAKYGIEEGNFVIGYSGRLVRDKGIIDWYVLLTGCRMRITASCCL